MIAKIAATLALGLIDLGIASGIGNMTKASAILFTVLNVMVLLGIWS